VPLNKKEGGKMKDTTIIIIAIVLILVIGGGISLPKFDLTKFNPFSGLGGNQGDSGLLEVDRKLAFSLIDQYAGSALGSKTLKIYDSDGSTILETLTTASDGTVNSAFPYKSDRTLYVYYASSSDKQWFKITVPKMSEADAHAITTNPIELRSFSIGTYTSDSLKFAATSISDSGSYNFTTSGKSQSFTYSLANTGNDNTGLISSYDPMYQMKCEPVLYVTFSGTDYEKITVYGFDYDFTLGTTHYVANEIDSYALTKHKVGNLYKSTGTQDTTFTLDMTALTGGTSSVTMQITVEMYSDPQYSMNHGGSFGPIAVQIAEQTVTING
jgi:hypothetical protein